MDWGGKGFVQGKVGDTPWGNGWSKTGGVFSWNSKALFVQLFSHAWLFVTPWTIAPQASLSINNTQSLLKLMSMESVMPTISSSVVPFSSHLQYFRVFSNESVLRFKWPNYWSFSFRISPSNKYSGQTSLRMPWLDVFAVQGILKRLLQHHIITTLKHGIYK